MKLLPGHIAVVTGGGAGMGRELCVQLADAGCVVATCDIDAQNLEGTAAACRAARSDCRILTAVTDVTDQGACLSFAEAVGAELGTAHVNALFNNAGIGGGGSFVDGSDKGRASWEACFNINWFGVYYMTRAFMEMLQASDEGVLVNTSSVAGFWGSLGPKSPLTAYAAAKFAVKGFTEALIGDFRVSAPHLKAYLVMPGAVGTSIGLNSTRLQRRLQGRDDALSERDVQRDAMAKDQAHRAEKGASNMLSPGEAASIILHHVNEGRWRILLGDDALSIDASVRNDPGMAYEKNMNTLMHEGSELRGAGAFRQGSKSQLAEFATAAKL